MAKYLPSLRVARIPNLSSTRNKAAFHNATGLCHPKAPGDQVRSPETWKTRYVLGRELQMMESFLVETAM